MLDMKPVEFAILLVPIALLASLTYGAYWVIRRTVRDGHNDAQRDVNE